MLEGRQWALDVQQQGQKLAQVLDVRQEALQVLDVQQQEQVQVLDVQQQEQVQVLEQQVQPTEALPQELHTHTQTTMTLYCHARKIHAHLSQRPILHAATIAPSTQESYPQDYFDTPHESPAPGAYPALARASSPCCLPQAGAS